MLLDNANQALFQWYPNAMRIRTPIDAGWLNRLDTIFSALQCNALTPDDFPDIESLETAILKFQALYNQIAKPFKWKYTKDDLKKTLSKNRNLTNNINHLRRAA